MKYSPAKCYKELMISYLAMSVGNLSMLPEFENYHPEYLVDYSIEDLEKAVKKFSKKGHTYFAFMAGMAWTNCLDDWFVDDMFEDEIEELIDASLAGLNSFMSLLGIKELSEEEISDMVDCIEDGFDPDDEDDDDEIDNMVEYVEED